MSADRNLYRHPSLGFTLVLPPSSELVENLGAVALVAAEPLDPDSAFRANIVVTVEEAPDGWADLDAYTDASLEMQTDALDAFKLIDRAPAELRGGQAMRTLGYHDSAGQAVTVEQWRLLRGTRAYTLTASCWTLDYDSRADAFADIAETFTP